MFNEPLLLFALNDSRVLGEEVGGWLATAPASHEEREFDGGEHKARPLTSVRGKDVFVIQTLHGDATHSANDKLCRLLFFIGALRDAAAARVTAVVPYLAYARKDSKTNPHDPVTTRYVAALFEAVGADVVVTLDVHNKSAFQNAFRCGTEHLDAGHLFVRHFQPILQGSDVVVVSPDAGGVKRANLFRTSLAAALDAPVGSAFCEKYRKGDVLSGELLVGEVGGKSAIIFDDMIGSGQTMARAARACREHGAQRVFAAASHGLFGRGAAATFAASGIDSIVVTDSVAQYRKEQDPPEHLTVLSCSALFAEAIKRMHGDGPVSELSTW
jgi:ribose-phosphate pyrophosphokinase